MWKAAWINTIVSVTSIESDRQSNVKTTREWRVNFLHIMMHDNHWCYTLIQQSPSTCANIHVAIFTFKTYIHDYLGQLAWLNAYTFNVCTGKHLTPQLNKIMTNRVVRHLVIYTGIYKQKPRKLKMYNTKFTSFKKNK